MASIIHLILWQSGPQGGLILLNFILDSCQNLQTISKWFEFSPCWGYLRSKDLRLFCVLLILI
jgi:hypothetical protein